MDNHITFEEMAEFLTCKKPDARFRELSIKINPHILRCEDCRKMYQSMLALSDAIDEVERSKRMPSFRTQAKEVFSDLKRLVQLKIDSLRNMVVEGGDFSRLSMAGITMSTNRSEEPNAGFYTNEDGVAIDYAKDGTLTIRFPKALCCEGTKVILQSRMNPQQIVTTICEEFDDDQVCATFYDIEPADYDLLYEP